MVTNKRNFMQWEVPACTHGRSSCFLLEGAGGDGIKKKFPLFPSYSQSVLKCCHQDVPNSTWVLPHMVYPKFNSHVYKLKRRVVREYICFYFATGVQRGAFIRESSTFQRKLMMGQWMWLFQKIKKHEKVMSTPINQLIQITIGTTIHSE
jgi:hypothetical protein